MSERKYLTFPIVIFKDGLSNIKESISNAMAYCLYYDYLKMEGSKTERIKAAANKLGIKFGNELRSFEIGKMLHDSITGSSPKTSIANEMMFDFLENDKTEKQTFTFLAFAALRSILQRQPYTKITNDYLIGRIAGNNKKGEPLPEWIFKYNNRYQLNNVKNELQLKWGLKLYARHTRGFYVSFSMPLEQLIVHAELKRKKYLEKQLKQTKEDARVRALKEIERRGI